MVRRDPGGEGGVKVHDLHRWDVAPAEGIRIQNDLRRRLVLSGGPRRVRLAAGADVSYSRRTGESYAVVVLWDAVENRVLETRTAVARTSFPYVPGLLAFREVPALLPCFRALEGEPDIVLFDSHGTAHPRGLGLACHLGLLLDVPSIGCAKSLLFGEHAALGQKRGATAPILAEGKRIGTLLRTRDYVKPVYVSPGHRIGMERAVEIVAALTRGVRLPEPTRLAHRATVVLHRSRNGRATR